MKYILGMMFISNFAFACPDLTGTFLCKSGSEVLEKTIENTQDGYYMNTMGVEMEYHTDGKSYELPATDSYQNAKIISTCQANKLVIDFSASILYEGSVIAQQVSKSTYSITNDQLIIVQKTKMKGIPLPTKTYTCSRK